MRRGSNLPAVGTYNQTLVLDLIRRSPEGISRIELAARTGLAIGLDLLGVSAPESM